MPIVQTTKPAAPESSTPAAVGEALSLMIDKDGKLTLAGQVVEAFLLSLDYSDIMGDPELAECLDVTEAVVAIRHGVAVELDADGLKRADEAFDKAALFKKKDDEDKKKGEDDEDEEDDKKKKGEEDDKKKADEAANKDDEDGDEDEEGEDEEDDDEDEEKDEKDESRRVFNATVETLNGAVAAELIDEDDLSFMFMAYVHDLPESTLVEKTTKAQAIQSLGLTEAELVEWKKGEFIKVHKSAQGKNKVSRMLLAMLAKQAIARAKPGQSRYAASGSKAPTYTKAGQSGRGDNYNPTGKVSYGHGTPQGIKKYYKFVGGHSAQSAAGEQKSGDKKKKSAADIAKMAKAKVSGKTMKAAPKANKKAAKVAALKKKVPGKAKKSLVAHDDSAVSKLHEGASLAGRILGKVSNGREMATPAKQITESTETKPAATEKKPSPFAGRASIIRPKGM